MSQVGQSDQVTRHRIATSMMAKTFAMAMILVLSCVGSALADPRKWAQHLDGVALGDTVVLRNGTDLVPVWKDGWIERGPRIIAERMARGEGIDESWLHSVTACVVPSGTKAELILIQGLFTTVIVVSEEGDCAGEVPTNQEHPQ